MGQPCITMIHKDLHQDRAGGGELAGLSTNGGYGPSTHHSPQIVVNYSGIMPDIQRTKISNNPLVVFESAAATLRSWPTGRGVPGAV